LLARLLGARILLATNAAGGINRNYRPGDLMAIRDCLSLSLLGVPAVDQIGDTTQAHVEYRGGIQNAARFLMDPAIHALILEQARKERVTLHSGTYCWLQGPSYETAAEIEMLRRVGADAVGMSTVPELITARQQGMKVGALSLISNLATGITPEKLSHADVTATAGSARASFVTLLQSILFRLS
jgi:purine-nucleoside phosphorylase